MNTKKIVVFAIASIMASSLCGCGGSKNNTKIADPAVTKAALKQISNHEGVYLNGIKTGIGMHLPEGFSIYNNRSYDTNGVILPLVIPTAESPLTVSSSDGSNFNFFASKGEDCDEFADMKQKDVEAEFLAGVEGVFENTEIVSFDTGKYGGFDGIKMVVDFELNGKAAEQTIITINAVNPETEKGFLYTLTFTDNTAGELKDAIEESASTINFATLDTILKNHDNPEELADSQTIKPATKAVTKNTTVTMPSRKPKVTFPKRTLPKRAQDILDRRKSILNDPDYSEETHTTLSIEELRKKYQYN